jgi:hypothetical protein
MVPVPHRFPLCNMLVLRDKKGSEGSRSPIRSRSTLVEYRRSDARGDEVAIRAHAAVTDRSGRTEEAIIATSCSPYDILVSPKISDGCASN